LSLANVFEFNIDDDDDNDNHYLCLLQYYWREKEPVR